MYYNVVPGNLDEIAEETGIAKSYLEAKMEDAFEDYHYYVVYYDGEWKDKRVSDQLSLEAVMRNLFRRLRKPISPE